MEIEWALKRKTVLVIPVLVEDAHLPLKEDLPEDLQPLTECQFLELTRDYADSDLSNLARIIRAHDNSDEIQTLKRENQERAAAHQERLIALVSRLRFLAIPSIGLMLFISFLLSKQTIRLDEIEKRLVSLEEDKNGARMFVASEIQSQLQTMLPRVISPDIIQLHTDRHDTTISRNNIQTFCVTRPEMRVIAGGFKSSKPEFASLMGSHPAADDKWCVTIRNPQTVDNVTMTVTVYGLFIPNPKAQ